MKTSQKTGPRVKAMMISTLDEYENKKQGILAKYLEANEKIKKSAAKSIENSVQNADAMSAENALKSL